MPTTIQISAAYANLDPIAQALAIGDNATMLLANLIEDVRDGDKSAAERIVSIWNDMESIGKLASMRTLLSRVSKKILGFGLTVKDGQLIEAATREKKSKGEGDAFLSMCATFATSASDDEKAMVMRLMETIQKQQ